jgi:hypothetical protein
MASSVFGNPAPVAHKGPSNVRHLGPDVCITPPGSPMPIPIPYPTVSAAPAAKSASEKLQLLNSKLQLVHQELMSNRKAPPTRTSQLLSSYVAIIMELRGLA